MKPSLVSVTQILAAIILVDQAQAGIERKGSDAVLTDIPRCAFAWPGWDYANTSNPVLLTKNTLDRSMIGIMRIRIGGKLPRGKTRIAAEMSTQQIAALLRENLQGRGEKLESITSSDVTVAGSKAVRLRYTQLGTPVHHGDEYGFIRGGCFFHLLFVAADGSDYAREQKDFEHIAATFRVLP